MNLQKSKVMHFMSPHLFYVKAEDILEQAEKVFHDHQLSTAPVLIDKKNVIGVLTDFQLLKCFLLRAAKPSRARIKDYASELDPVVLIDQNEPLESAFRLMVQSPNHRLYVTEQGRLVGALSPKDLLPFLAGDAAVERYKDDKDLIDARMRIKVLFHELSRTQADLDRYQQIFTSSPYMIHSVDLNGVITMANPMLHSVLGYPEGALIGKSILDLYPEQFHAQALAGLARIKDTGYHPFVNTLMVKSTQELVQVDMATSAKHDAEGNIIATVTISRISDLGKMVEALAHAAEAFDAAHAAALKTQAKLPVKGS